MAKLKTKRRRKRSTKVSGKRRPVKRKAAKRKPVKRKAVKRKPAKRKKSQGRKLVKQVEKRSVERVMAGKKRKRRSAPKRRVVMAGTTRRRRVAGDGGGGSKMLIGLAIGAAAIYFLTKKSAPTYPANFQLPPITQTGNYTRNTQSQDIVNYAMAGGLALDAVMKLIDRLNSGSDQEVQNIYDVYQTNGVQGLEYYV